MYPKLSPKGLASLNPFLIPYLNTIISFIPIIQIHTVTHKPFSSGFPYHGLSPCFQPQHVKTGLPPQTRHFPPPNSHPCFGHATRGNTCRGMPRPQIMGRGSGGVRVRWGCEDTHWHCYQPGCWGYWKCPFAGKGTQPLPPRFHLQSKGIKSGS